MWKVPILLLATTGLLLLLLLKVPILLLATTLLLLILLLKVPILLLATTLLLLLLFLLCDYEFRIPFLITVQPKHLR